MTEMDAIDRLFGDFVVLVMIGVAIGIALFVIKAFRKIAGGWDNG
jgi:uncharacterized membrane protein YdfJ with MMPL/SSD domain